MAGKVSRRKMAEYAAEKLLEKDPNIIRKIAAYMVMGRRQREVGLLVRDIEFSLSQKGVLIADLATARDLEKSLEREIVDFLKAKTGAREIHLRKNVDETLIGGVRLATPVGTLDSSVATKLATIKNNYLKER